MLLGETSLGEALFWVFRGNIVRGNVVRGNFVRGKDVVPFLLGFQMIYFHSKNQNVGIIGLE
jgi:hypothetical protein